MALLSICIPTYNRAEMVVSLVQGLLCHIGDFQICVHVDGSEDNSYQKLSGINDQRLLVSYSSNRGRASALLSAVSNASGRYCMLFDDDDDLYADGLSRVLQICEEDLQLGCVGFIFHLADDNGERVGSSFPVARSNLIALRADHGVTGDKKEVILTSVLRAAMTTDMVYRRVPTSLYWSRISLESDVICFNEIIGRKTYIAGGMSDSIRRLKRDNAGALVSLHRTRLVAFRKRRYSSWLFAVRSLIAVIWYGVQSKKNG